MNPDQTASLPAFARKRFWFFLSAAAFCVLLLRPLRTSFVVAPAVAAALTVLLLRFSAKNGGKTADAGRRLFWAAAVSVLLGGVFVTVWLRTLRIVSLHFIDWKHSLPVLAAAVVSVPLSVPFLGRLLKAIALWRDGFRKE